MTIEASMSLSGMHAKTSGGGMSMETEAELPDDSDCKEAGNVVNACLVIMLLCSGFAGFLFNTKPQGQMAKIGQGVAVFTCVFGLPAVIQHPAKCLEGDATLASGWCLFTFADWLIGTVGLTVCLFLFLEGGFCGRAAAPAAAPKPEAEAAPTPAPAVELAEAVGAPAPAATEEPKAEEPKAEEPNQV
eukprot:CAMPEP_0178984708 /NCGR_PEP_ID=MMETSP0795-20121207/1760_1 /TAXON_ID=88552 /ORGANISM="Amoebophrya sp., Strain Ameob2" /LENGTH=187 /DNA_ID=CAMNT_0020675611 /DNA_START=353 /DNA_END=916 /DNA_ORIENTATION=+